VSLRRLALVVALAAFAAFAAPARVGAANECNGIPRCIPIEGPWVAVPASGEVEFELSCPQGKGVIAGTDAEASSQDVHATFDGILGAPVAFGRTTNSAVLFRAVAGRHRPGSFKPFVGCIPSQNQVQNTLATKPTPLGPPLDLRSALVPLAPGSQRTVTISCPIGEFLVDSWTATAFTTAAPPPLGLAAAVEVKTYIKGRRATLALSASEALPVGTGAEVQVGVRCATE
jgi:hypothetical protein